MKKILVSLLFILILLGCLLAPAFAQTYTRLGASQVIYTADNQPDTKAFLTVYKVIYAGRPVSLTPKTYRTDSSGYLVGDDGSRGIRLIAGAQVWLYSPITIVPGISRNPQAGTQYTVPASSATQLEELIYDLTLFGSKGSSIWGTSSGKPSTLAAGTDGYLLVADSAQTLGVKWAAFAPSLFGSQSANRVLAGPTTGSAASPTFRALVAGDIPDLSATYAAASHTHTLSNLTQSGATSNQVPQWNGSAWVPATINSAVWGAITGTLASQTDLQSALDAKQALATALTQISGLSPTNDDIIQRKAGAWTNRTVAQFKSDLGLATVATSGSASDLGTGTLPDARFPSTLPALNGSALTALNASNLTSGTVAAARGGAGTVSGVLKANGSGVVSAAVAADIPDLSATYLPLAGGTLTGNAVISNAAPSLAFTDTTASAKSLTIAVDANIANLRESAGVSGSLLALDLANNRVGIGTATPSNKLTVSGDADVTGFLAVGTSAQTAASEKFVVRNSSTTGSFLMSFFNGSGNGAYIANSGSSTGWNYNQPTNTTIIAADYVGGGSYGGLAFATGGAGRVMISASGLVGINSTSPAAQLDVRPSSNSTIGQIIRLASGQTANALNIENSTGTLLSGVLASGAFYSAGVAFASLGTPSNGTFVFCTDCTIASPCASGGTGALAKRLNSVWVCN